MLISLRAVGIKFQFSRPSVESKAMAMETSHRRRGTLFSGTAKPNEPVKQRKNIYRMDIIWCDLYLHVFSADGYGVGWCGDPSIQRNFDTM